MNKPNLLNIPSAYKAGKIYSPIPESGAGDLAFTRAGVANRINSSGIIEQVGANVPRLDYSGGGCPSWLFEPQRTNLVKYSEDFTNAVWNPFNSSVSANASTAPNGTLTADKLVENTSLLVHGIRPAAIISFTSGAAYSLSVFAKADERNFLRLEGVSQVGAYFNLTTGSKTQDADARVLDSEIISISNGWYKCSITLQEAGRGTDYIYCFLSLDGTTKLYQGDGVSGLYIWGAQLEQGGYPTSYIKTEASQVTRNTDATTAKDLSSYVTPTNGAMMADIESILGLRDGAFNCVVLGTTNGRLFIYDSTINNYIQANVQNTDGSFSTVELTKRSKVLFNWTSTNVDIWVDGVKALSTSKAFSLTNTNLFLDGRGKLANIYKLGLWNTTLTDLEAIEQTT